MIDALVIAETSGVLREALIYGNVVGSDLGNADWFIGDGSMAPCIILKRRSAEIEAHDLHLKAVKSMGEVEVDISSQKSETIDIDFLNKPTLVVTLCRDAKDRCPVTTAHIKREHWGFDDPAKAEGTDEEVWQVFLRVRDEIGERIRKFTEIEK